MSLLVPPVLLVLRALHLGDLLTAVPALRALRRHRPAHRLILAGPAGLAPIAALIGGIDEVWPTDDLRWSGPWPPRPDIAVNLHGRGPRSHQLLDQLAPRHRIGHAAPGWSGPDWLDDLHERHRWCRLLDANGIPADPADLRLDSPGDSRWPDATVVNPGASYGSRRWPARRFALVAAGLLARGHRVVVTGTAAERYRAVAVAEHAGLPSDSMLAGRTGPRELAALIARARLVVTADTGVAHLSYAYATPSVVLFGPAPASQWGPPADGPHIALSTPDRRRGDAFAETPDPALLGVEVPAVLTAANMLVSRR